MSGSTTNVYAGTAGAVVPIATDTRDSKIYQRTLSAPCPAAGAAVSSVNDTAASTTLLTANAERLGVIIYNDSPQDLRIKYGATASATSFSYLIPAYGTWEMPNPIYVGIIDGLWAADASGAARITELT